MTDINNILKPTEEEKEEQDKNIERITQEAQLSVEKADRWMTMLHNEYDPSWGERSTQNRIGMGIAYGINALYKQLELIAELLKRKY
ncbi:hypothetical protein JW756_03875 [Candidatus Woesearchaeota archaeon]|nr:hypothetical protein [Candidatus Woesearchaeota archaeon]